MSDGGTALLTGWTHHREVRNLVAAPVLTKVPYLNQLFRNFSYGKEREHLLVMVTTHVVVRREQEPLAPATLEECKTGTRKLVTQAVPVPERLKPECVKQVATTAAWEVNTSANPPQIISPAAVEPARPCTSIAAVSVWTTPWTTSARRAWPRSPCGTRMARAAGCSTIRTFPPRATRRSPCRRTAAGASR